jgi:hypothetical protein
MGILATRQEDENSVSFDIECPHDYRETPNLAHISWIAGVMSEMCGQLPLFLGTMAFAGTVTTRFQALVPTERLIGRATFEGREQRKAFVDATLTSSVTGTELAKASATTVAVEMRTLEDRGLTWRPICQSAWVTSPPTTSSAATCAASTESKRPTVVMGERPGGSSPRGMRPNGRWTRA